MKHGDIVVVGGRKGVALNVNQAEIILGQVNADRPGLHVFAGFWYGTNPLNSNCYGKILTDKPDQRYRVIGKAINASQLKYLGV